MLIEAKSKTLTENVTDQILTLIRTGIWKPGELLPSENQLTQQLGVSRACVREALQAVAQIGVVELRAGRRARVKAPTARSLFDPGEMAGLLKSESLVHLWQVRMAIEVAAVRLATELIDQHGLERLEHALADQARAMEQGDFIKYNEADLAFHQYLIQGTGNPIFVELYETIRRGIQTSQSVTARSLGMQRGVLGHSAILGAVKAKDPVAAEAAMRSHLGVSTMYLDALAKLPRGGEGAASGSSAAT
jgi:GntR family transcriptional repressor for pyruvate dehydrogenase complex